MKKIQQVNELSALLQDLHGVEVTPCELLELEDYNYTLAHQRAGQLATSDLCEITCDVGKAIGFIIGAVLGAFILPGLGFGITGWFAGAVAGGALGYRLVSLFDGSQGAGQRTDVVDSSTRFSGAGQLGQLGSIIPIVYGNKDVNPDGGVVVRDPTIIYSRISAGLGVQYIERLSLLTIGRVGRVNVSATLFNDQPMPELNRSIDVNKGTSPQSPLGSIDHYSQAVALSVNNQVGTRRVISVRQLGAARGATATAANLVGVTGTGTGTISKVATTLAWDGSFTCPALSCPVTLGSYVFSRAVIGGVAPIKLAMGFSYPGASTGVNPDTMDIAYVIDGTSWSLIELGIVQGAGSNGAIVPGAALEVRVYYTGVNACWVQLLCNTVEIDRTPIPFGLPNGPMLPDFSFFSTSNLSSRTTGVVAALATAGNVTPGLGTRFPVEVASLSKLVVGKTYDGAGENFAITLIDPAGFIEVYPSLWIADIAITSAIGSLIIPTANFNESFSGAYRTTIPVQSIELLLEYSVWGKTAANAAAIYAQAFKVEMRKVSVAAWVLVGTYLIQGDTEAVKSTVIAITNLAKNFYEIRLVPIDAAGLVATAEVIDTGSAAISATTFSIEGSTATPIIQRASTLTNALAKTQLNLQPIVLSTERGASIRISHCNEIVNPFGTLQATPSVFPVGSGTGLKGDYFAMLANGDSGALLGTRTDAQVLFNSSQVVSFAGWSATRHFIIWTGSIIPRQTATYTFEVTFDDFVQLIINDQELLKPGRVGSSAPWYGGGVISLIAGREYSIRVVYQNTGGSGQCALRWSAIGLPKELVPQSQLKPTTPNNATAELQSPTYPGYLIARTKLTSSNQLSSAPSEAYDVELGAVIRQYLAFARVTTASSAGSITDNTGPFGSAILAVGDIAKVIGKGSMVVTPGTGRDTLTCQSYVGSVFAATTNSLLVFDYALWLNALPGMTLTAAGIPAGAVIGEVLPNNRIRLADRWGRELKATIPTGNVEMNKSVATAVGDSVVVYRMGSSNYFPDCYVDRLINPISGLGNYINEDHFIDYRSIVRARAWCVANKFYFDGRIGDGTFEAWAIQTAPSSLLFATEINGRYGLLIQDDAKPVYLFNDSNCDYTEPGVPFEAQLTNTVLVGYQDRLGKAKQLKIQTTNANNGTDREVIKTISAPGVTSQTQAIKVGQVALKSLIVQASVCTITTDVAVGLYCQQGNIVRTQHRAIEYNNESSGFVTAIGATSNSRSVNRVVAIDRIEGYRLTTTTRLNLTPDPADVNRTTDTMVISGNSAGANNVALVSNAVGLLDDYRLSVNLVDSGTGGNLTISRTIIDQEVTLSEPLVLTANSRFICTHRGSRTTESDLLMQLVSGNTFKVIGLAEPLAIGDAWAVGVQSEYFKTWRLTSIQPDILANKVTFAGVAWTADILTSTGLVTVIS